MASKTLLIGLLLVSGCTRQQSGSSEQVAKQQNSQSTNAAPPSKGFVVDVSLSEQAMKKLAESKETVIVSANLSGRPKKGALKRYVDEMGRVGGLGDVEIEIAPGKSARFEEIKMKEDAFEQTDKQSPELLINVFSGRKSSEDNLLACGIYEGKLIDVEGRSIPIACKLLQE